VSASTPRRDNGLTAPSYVRLDDVDTHLVDELLDRLAQNGVAAYSAPSVGRQGPYGDVVPPPGPSDSVYVDTEHRDRARAVTDTYLREIRDELAWSDIVAGFDSEPDGSDGGVPRWPVSEDVDPDDDRTASATATGTLGPTIGFEELRANSPTSPVVRREDPADDPDDHFRPPPPPPLPEIDRVSRFAWAGALGGPALLVLATLLGLQLEGWVGLLALGGFMAGFVTLVARMKDRPPNDTGPDDGAVV
jgi:hypothetical protein